MPDKMEILDHALKYAARGWPVFALQPREKKPLAGSRGFKDAATNEILVTRAWDDRPDANIGMATGRIAEVWVLDIDGEHGSQSLTAMEGEFGPLPETLEQRTGSGGRHLFFRWLTAREVRNKQNLRPGIDIRGEGGYIVLPPSIHPNGQEYTWPYGQDTPIVDAPPEWMNVIAPAKKRLAPWEQQPEESAPVHVPVIGSTPILERARRYLAECPPAVQGSGGHNSLLWAARAMAVGFELPVAAAIDLLWSEYNPRCVPPWEQSDSSQRRDFERKVGQAIDTPGEKPAGWLLDEYGLRSGEEAMADIAAGNRHATALLARHAPAIPGEYVPEGSNASKRMPFPTDYFPPRIADYCRQSAESKVVCPSFFGLPMLAVAGAAMGNAWRLRLKKDFIVPPLLWVALVARSGGCKTAPLKQVKGPLDDPIPIEDLPDAVLNPQGIVDIGDATTEMTIQLLGENPRGLLVFRDELAGWAAGFDAYKSKGGGDQQKWIEFWGAGAYRMHRKTGNERVYIPAAAVTIMGGMQPKILRECFDPGKFDSGLVPRILVTCPPNRKGRWTEAVVNDDVEALWTHALMWLRTRPFAGLDSNRNQYLPRYLEFEPKAKDIYVSFHNQMEQFVDEAVNDHVRAFAAKAQQNAGRMCLIHRGLWLAENPDTDLGTPVGVESAVAGVEWMTWCLDEQMRVYGFAAEQYAHGMASELADVIRGKNHDGRATVRELMRWKSSKYKNAEQSLAAMQSLVGLGLARWTEPKKEVVLI